MSDRASQAEFGRRCTSEPRFHQLPSPSLRRIKSEEKTIWLENQELFGYNFFSNALFQELEFSVNQEDFRESTKLSE